MSFARSFNEWLSIVIKLMVITVIILAVVWGGASLIAHFTEKALLGTIPDYPSIAKAPYVVLLKTTGTVLLTKEYNIVADGTYVLHGYYNLYEGKWKWYDTDLQLSKLYFGDIEIKRREE